MVYVEEARQERLGALHRSTDSLTVLTHSGTHGTQVGTHGTHSGRYSRYSRYSLRYSRCSPTQVRMCAHRALTTIGQSCATATGREPWSSSLAGVTVWPQRYVRTVVRQCVRPTPLRVEANTAQQSPQRIASRRIASHRIASPQRTHLSAEVELVQLGRGGEELAEVVVLRHHRVRQRQRCDHVEERRSHLIARGDAMRPSVTLTGCGRIEMGAHERALGGRTHARRHWAIRCQQVGKRTAMHRALG